MKPSNWRWISPRLLLKFHTNHKAIKGGKTIAVMIHQNRSDHIVTAGKRSFMFLRRKFNLFKPVQEVIKKKSTKIMLNSSFTIQLL